MLSPESHWSDRFLMTLATCLLATCLLAALLWVSDAIFGVGLR